MKKIKVLIESLSSREKSYFSSMFQQSRDKHFYKLYQALLKQPDVELSTVKKKFKNIPQIHYELNHLYQQLIRSLVIYRYNSSEPEYNLLKLMQETQVLIEKKKHNEALRRIKRGKKIAYIIEDYSTLLKLIYLEEEVGIEIVDTHKLEKMAVLESEKNECLETIKKYNQYKYLNIELINLKNIHGFIIAKDEFPPELLNHPLYQEEPKSIKSKYIFFFCKALRALYLTHYEEAFDYQGKVIEHVGDNIGIFTNENLIKSNYNYLNMCMIADDLKEFALRDQEMKELLALNRESIFVYYYRALKLRFYSLNQNLELLREELPAVLQFIRSEEVELNISLKDTFYSDVIFGYVFLKDYSSAQEVVHEWKMSGFEELRGISLKILSLVVFLGLRNFKLLKYERATFLKTLTRKGKLNPVYELFGKLLKDCIAAESVEKEVIENYQLKFEVLQKQLTTRKYFVDFNFTLWLKYQL